MQLTCKNCQGIFEFDPSAQQHDTGFVYCPHCYFQNPIPPPPSAYLTMELEDGSVQKYPLGTSNSIGRHPNNTIQIMDRMISKHHARLVFQGGHFLVEDLQSRNGTFINGQRISDASIRSGDELQLGTVKFHCFVGAQADETINSALQSAEDSKRHQVTIIGGEDLSAQIAQVRHEMEARDFLPERDIRDTDSLRRDYEKLRITHELNRKIGLQLDQDVLFNQILEETFKLIQADRGVILMMDGEGNWEPKCVLERYPDESRKEEINISKTILQAVVEERSAILSSDAKIDERFSSAESVIMQGIRSSMSIPLISRSNGEILGVMHLDTQNAIGVFTEKDLQLMSVVASQAGDAIDNSRMAKKIEKETIIRAHLQRFLSPAVMTRLTQDDLEIRMGGEMVEATMMFTDIRGFTSLSEGFNPQELIQELNTYFDLLVDIIFAREGTLDKFIGDAIMAVWGTPQSRPEDALHAVQAAVEIQAILKGFNVKRVEDGKPPFYTGIGINTGEVVAGNMGSPKRLEFTVIGDGVNLASRLCSEAKANEVIISESTRQHLGDMFDFTRLPDAKVKGKKDPIKIYRVEGYSKEHSTNSPETEEPTSTHNLKASL